MSNAASAISSAATIFLYASEPIIVANRTGVT